MMFIKKKLLKYLFFFVSFLLLIISYNSYSSDAYFSRASFGLRCEINEWNQWSSEAKKLLKKAISLPNKKYYFIVPSSVRYYEKGDQIQCIYRNKVLSINITEVSKYDDIPAGHFSFKLNMVSKIRGNNNDSEKNKSAEYRLYSHGDGINARLIFSSTFPLSSRMYPKFHHIGAIRVNKSYYFVVIIKKNTDQHMVYAMKIMPKYNLLRLNEK